MKIMNYKYTQHGTYKHNAERKKLVVSIKFKKRRHGTVLLEIRMGSILVGAMTRREHLSGFWGLIMFFILI